MPITVLMPALSPTMTEGKLATWMKNEGDEVVSGDVLCEIETDKATMEVEAVDEGVLGRILVASGTENVAVNAPIALLLEEGEDSAALDGAEAAASSAVPAAANPAPATAAAVPAAAAAPAPSSAPTPGGGRVFASPLARRLAARNGLDLGLVKGSGPHGRVVKRDIEKALAEGTGKPAPAGAPAPKAPAAAEAPAFTVHDPILAFMPGYAAVENSTMRKVIAKRLTESARDVPHFNLTLDVEIDKLLALRRELNGREGADYKLSVNDFFIKAAALALRKVPDANAAYTDAAILKFDRVDMSMAVAVEGGLITPIIKGADTKGLATISAEAKALAAKAREGKLQPEEFQGGTFTISNLGMFGVKGFNSILNPPQAGILSVGAGEQRPVVRDGALAIATVVTLTLAVDHRCIDGALAAEYAKELKALIQDPIALML